MKQNFREHYGQKFHLKIDNTPVAATDCFSRLFLILGLFLGFLFLVLGSYLIGFTTLSGSTDFERHIAQTTIKIHSLVSTQTFSYIMLLLGFGIVFVCIFHLFRRKKIFFDGQKIIVKDHPVFGKPHSFEESISSYTGVRLRLKFCQYGLLNRNKFIIELYHDDPEKIVPLYISINPKHIRSLWREYALKLNLQPIHLSEKGMVSHSPQDMDKSYADRIKGWDLPKDFIKTKQHTNSIICKQKNDKKLIKARSIKFDAYSILNLAVIALLSIALSYCLYAHTFIAKYISLNFLLALDALLLTLIVYSFLTLMLKDLILIHKKRIIVFRKLFGFAIQDAVIPFETITNIDVPFSPATSRYCLQITTHKQTINIFNKHAADDLRWIRGFIICEMMD